MNPQKIAWQYMQRSTQGANRVGLVVRLYDTILEDLRRALEAARNGEIERRVKSLNHALLVIAELESVLDHKNGGEVANRLKGLYQVTRALILQENLRSKPEGIERLIALYLPVRQAWQEAERNFRDEDNRTVNPRRQTVDAVVEEAPRSGWNV
jgi:flagellar biosynthetic protein FliS